MGFPGCRVADSTYSRSLDVLQKLRSFLLRLPCEEVTGQHIADVLELLQHPPSTTIPFGPPEGVHLVGSWATRTTLRERQVADLALVMPSKTFRHKDQLNYRYHARRAIYLSHVAKTLQQEDWVTRVEVEYLRGNYACPVVVVTLQLPGPEEADPMKVRLLPTISEGTFAIHKLSPMNNNVRWVTRTAAGKPGTPSSGEQKEHVSPSEALVPTPHYNAGVLEDLLAISSHDRLMSTYHQAPQLSEGVLLLKLWALNWKLYCQDGVHGALLSWLVAHLYSKNPLVAMMRPLQLVRTSLEFLVGQLPGGCQLDSSLGAGKLPQGSKAPSMSEWKKGTSVVVLDPSGWRNLTAHMTASMRSVVLRAARSTLELLRQYHLPSYVMRQVFCCPHSFATTFDYHWKVRVEPVAAHSPGDLPASRQQEAQVEAVIRKALGDRATLVWAQPRSLSPSSPLSQGSSGPPFTPRAVSSTILVGGCLSPSLALRLVDVGPSADDAAAAAKFRAFWGEKAELRRFLDGKISEAVVWSCGPAGRHRIPDWIVEYILRRHVPGLVDVQGCSGALDAVLMQKGVEADAEVQAARLLESAMDKLSKELRNLSDLALKVTVVQPVAPVLRHTAAFPPLPHPLAGGPQGGVPYQGLGGLPRCLEPVEVLVHLEGSGRWPEDPVAYVKTKAALGLQLAAALEKACGHTCVPSEECVDVLAEGFAFRLVICGDRDQGVAERIRARLVASATGAQGLPPPSSPDLPTLMSRLLAPPRQSHHHGLISLVAGLNPPYGPTVRLAKRWVASHMMSHHLREEAVELLVAAAVMPWGQVGVPAQELVVGSRLSGFLRFLHLLATFPWSSHPLVVDPEKEMTESDYREVQSNFSQHLKDKETQGPYMWICTPRDKESKDWTHHHPAALVLKHLVVLASRSAAHMTQYLQDTEQAPSSSPSPPTPPLTAAPSIIFLPTKRDFDMLVLLRKEALPFPARQLPGHPFSKYSAKNSLKRKAGVLEVQHGGKAEGSVLEEILTEMGQGSSEVNGHDVGAANGTGEPRPKKSRAVLECLPQKVVDSTPRNKLVSELLVGFDPVTIFMGLLEEHLGHLATFCSDPLGGPVVGVKWKPEAFLPSALDVSRGHTSLPCVLLEKGDGQGGCVPHILLVTSTMLELGEGLVEDIVVM